MSWCQQVIEQLPTAPAAQLLIAFIYLFFLIKLVNECALAENTAAQRYVAGGIQLDKKVTL